MHRSTDRRFHLFPIYVLLFILCNAAVLHAQSALGKSHVDRTLGFSIRVPKGWKSVPPQEGEKYIVGTYVSDRLLTARKVKDWKEMSGHRPEMRIIAFTPENKAIEARREKKEEVLGVEVTTIYEQNPYRDFKEYTKRTASGFYFGDESSAKVGKIPCDFLEVILEQHRPPLRRSACVYHLGDVDVAVYFEVMEEWHPKYKSLFTRCFRSFRTVKREAKAPAAVAAEGKPLTREEFIASKTDDLPEGWWWTTSKSHLLISHTDKKYTQKVGSFADAVRKMLEKRLGKITARIKKKKQGKAVSLPIIRICDTPAEFNAFIKTSRGYNAYNSETKEVVVYNGTREGYPIEWVYSRIGYGIYLQYMDDLFSIFISPDRWYLDGMGYYYASFRGRGSSLKYVRDDWERDQIREALRKGNASSFRDLLAPGAETRNYTDFLKVGTLMAFLYSREGMKKPWRGLNDRYLENFVNVLDEKSRALKKDLDHLKKNVAKGEAPEQGEDAHKKMEKKYDPGEIRKLAWERTFDDWTDRDWTRLEKAWRDWVL